MGLCRAGFGRGRSRVGRYDWVLAMAEDVFLGLAKIQKADWKFSSPMCALMSAFDFTLKTF